MTRVDIDAKGGRAKKKPKAWSKSPPGKDEADHYDHYDDYDDCDVDVYVYVHVYVYVYNMIHDQH